MRCNMFGPSELRRMSEDAAVCSSRKRLIACLLRNGPSANGPQAMLLFWNGGRAHRRRVEPGEFSVSANHAPAARSVRAAAQARAAVRVLGGGSVDPRQARITSTDPEFEKEAWLSMVMLEWGSCGQMASAPAGGRADATDDDSSEQCGDAPCLGYAFYAPPGAVPRAGSFPAGRSAPTRCCSPRSGSSPAHGADGAGRSSLIAAVVGDLVRRGVRALEAFGRTEAAAELIDPRLVPLELRPVVEVLGDCSVDQCILDADFLEGRRLRRGRAAPLLPAAAPRAGAAAWAGRPTSRRRWSDCWRASSCNSPSARARAPAERSGTDGDQLGLTRPAWSTDSSWASSSANVKVPVGRSFLPSRYSRLTAARMPSAIESRVWVDTSMARSRGLVM